MCERELKTEQKLQYIDPHSYGHQRCVFLVLLMLNRKPRGSAFCTTSCHQLSLPPSCHQLSLPHLVTNSSDLQLNRVSQGPFLPGGGFLYHILSLTRLISNSSALQLVLTELYNSSIAHSIFGMACLIVIKRK